MQETNPKTIKQSQHISAINQLGMVSSSGGGVGKGSGVGTGVGVGGGVGGGVGVGVGGVVEF